MIEEGEAKIEIKKNEKISKEMEVFYNPIMKLNRDISILLLKTFFNEKIRVADILAGSGVRSIRLIKEAGEKIKSIDINDASLTAVKNIKKNIEINNIRTKGKTIIINIHNKEANKFLLESEGFDYIDIDPFGSPNPFLDCAIKKISRNGVLAVTATDTAPLAGTYEKTCKRKYWAKPLRNYMMHEIALRILIRKIQLIGCQYEKALSPLLSYAKEHYYRVFLKCEKSKEKCNTILEKHKFLGFCKECLNIELFIEEEIKDVCKKCSKKILIAGPLWSGKLGEHELAEKMLKYADSNSAKLLETLKEEFKINCVGFYKISNLCKIKKIKNTPKINDIIANLKNKKIVVSRTHFCGDCLKTENFEELKNVINSLVS
ncbi:MAG: tRNA (guanine(10)-N(2))-dimethyltransferase [Candidatus Woesearchaeota archaeon]